LDVRGEKRNVGRGSSKKDVEKPDDWFCQKPRKKGRVGWVAALKGGLMGETTD